jgi:hypothetical protein
MKTINFQNRVARLALYAALAFSLQPSALVQAAADAWNFSGNVAATNANLITPTITNPTVNGGLITGGTNTTPAIADPTITGSLTVGFTNAVPVTFGTNITPTNIAWCIPVTNGAGAKGVIVVLKP